MVKIKVMEDNDFLDKGLKRLAYTTFQEVSAAALFTIYYGESLQHFATFMIAAVLNVFALPVILLTDFFSGLTGVEWYMIVILWFVGLVAGIKTAE